MLSTSSVLLSLFLALSVTQALVLNTPVGAVTGEPLEISFEAQPSDPTFSLELESFELHDSFAIANNVDPSSGAITVILPCVPTDT